MSEVLKKGMERITIKSGPDESERYTYVMEWVDDYFPGHPEGENVTRWRGQYFFGKIPERFKGPLNLKVPLIRRANSGK